MTDMIGKVARAIVDYENNARFLVSPKKYREQKARAAISAMREPTEGMVTDGAFKWVAQRMRNNFRGSTAVAENEIEATWQAMIDAALK